MYDIALHLSGSIEGIIDLFISNENLSFNKILEVGEELIYTDDFVIDNDIVAYLNNHDLTPSNGERNVYYKTVNMPKIIEIVVNNEAKEILFEIKGDGTIDIDWDDNSPISTFSLTDKIVQIHHYFDNQIPTNRTVKIHGQVSMKQIDLQGDSLVSMYVLKPLYLERLNLKNTVINLDFVSLLNGIFQIEIHNSSISSLLPLLDCKHLMDLNLKGTNIRQKDIDNYLVELVKQYGDRRNCIVSLPTSPSGIYREPPKDSNENYVLSSGFEAIWIITHEIAWNSGGNWRFIISNDKEYAYEQNN